MDQQVDGRYQESRLSKGSGTMMRPKRRQVRWSGHQVQRGLLTSAS